MIKFEIGSTTSGHTADVVRDDNHADGIPNKPYGIAAYTHPMVHHVNNNIIASNDSYGPDLNQNISAGGTPLLIHNGGDSAGWSASTISGTWDFVSTDQANSGAQSIDASGTVGGAEALFNRDSGAITFGNYESLSGSIYLSSWSLQGDKDVSLRFRLAGTNVSNELNLSEYISTITLNAWQNFSIGLSDFAIVGTTLDQLVVKTIDIGAGQAPNYYLDDIQFEETGAPAIFKMAPNSGQRVAARGLELILVDALNPTATDGASYGYSYNKILNVNELQNGIIFRWYRKNKLRFSGNVKNLFDFLNLPGSRIVTSVSDSTNTMLKIRFDFTTEIELLGSENDRIEIVIRDDLSGLLKFRATLIADLITSVIEDVID